MINIPNNLPNFLLTQISGPEKPLSLKIADYLLAPLRIQSSYEETVINNEGLPRKTAFKDYIVPEQLLRIMTFSSPIVMARSPLFIAIKGSVYLSAVFMATSFAIIKAKNLNTFFLRK